MLNVEHADRNRVGYLTREERGGVMISAKRLMTMLELLTYVFSVEIIQSNGC